MDEHGIVAFVKKLTTFGILGAKLDDSVTPQLVHCLSVGELRFLRKRDKRLDCESENGGR